MTGSGPLTDPFGLERFVRAQTGGHEQALGESQAGHKPGHWMGFVLPQLRGLGHSGVACHDGLSGGQEPAADLAHPLPGPRLRQCLQALLTQHGHRARDIPGPADALTLPASLTPYAVVAGADQTRFAEALRHGFDGVTGAHALALLARP